MRGVRRPGFRNGVFISIFVALSLLGVVFSEPSPSPAMPEKNPSVPAANQAGHDVFDTYQSMGGYFIENRGQVAEPVRFYSMGNPSVGFMDDGVMFVLRKETGEPEAHSYSAMNGPASRNIQVESFAYKLRFEGANPVKPVGIDRLPFDSNFFIGNDSSKWMTNVPSYSEVVYRNLYEGIDLNFRSSGNGVKYEFHVRAGADPGVIAMTYEGASSLEVSESMVLVRTQLGDIRDSAPISYQDGGKTVRCPFKVRDGYSIGFLCEQWDSSKNLVIDPLVYSTLIGGSASELGHSIVIDPAGNAFVAGWTTSLDFPTTPGALDISMNQSDGFMLKLNPAGSALAYSTYIGGSDHDSITGLGVDSSGNAYVAGETYSTDFPTTPGAFDKVYDNPPASETFALKLSSSGDSLSYSTFLGGSSDDRTFSLAMGNAGEAYVVGWTGSSDFPVTPGSYDTVFDGTSRDVYVVRLNSGGSGLVYATYLGGNETDLGISIAVDVFGDAYVTGWTQSSDFPTTPGAFKSTYGGNQDAFVTKLDASGSNLLFSTYIGGGDEETGMSIALGPQRDAFVTGFTFSRDFPVTPGAFDMTCGTDGDCDFNGVSYFMDAFVTRMNVSGSGLTYSTYLGGRASEQGTGLAIDPDGRAYVAGFTSSFDFPMTLGTFDSTLSGIYDVFATKLNTTGDAVNYSTLMGGGDRDDPWSAAVDKSGFLYMTGQTWSPDFPTTPGAFDRFHNGGRDVLVTKLEPVTPDLTVSPTDIAFTPPSPVIVSTTVTIDATVHNIGDGNATQVAVRFFDGPPLGGVQIGTDQILTFIGRSSGSDVVSVSWLPVAPGVHSVCILVDPEDAIPELNETNNQACTPIDVRLLMPDLTISVTDISFSPLPPFVEGASVSVTATVHNAGGSASGPTLARFHLGNPPSPQIGADQSLPSIPMDGRATVTVSWIAGPPGSHDICVIADPENLVAESNENDNMACAQIEVLTLPDYVLVNPQPASPLTVGLSMRIELSLGVLNAGGSMPSSPTTIAFFNGTTPSSPIFTYVLSPIPAGATIGPYAMDWTSPANPGTYFVTADVDILNQVVESNETNNLYTWTIEVVAGPITSLAIGNPNYTATLTYVKSSTPLDFSVVDHSGQGILNTTYRIDGGDWRNYTATGQFSLAGEGQHEIEWYSIDRAGNVEGITATNITVDDAPPATVIYPAEDELASGTLFTLTATDTGCGVNVTMYRVDGGNPIQYVGGFTLSPGVHDIYYYSVDHLGNTEAEKHALVTVKGPPGVAVNYKPLVAVIFAIILLVAGVWSSKRRPWKGGKDRMAVAKAFMITSLPFVLLEAATGLASLITGNLSIPPAVGIGTGVDLAVLMAGLAVAIFRMRMRTIKPE